MPSKCPSRRTPKTLCTMDTRALDEQVDFHLHQGSIQSGMAGHYQGRCRRRGSRDYMHFKGAYLLSIYFSSVFEGTSSQSSRQPIVAVYLLMSDANARLCIQLLFEASDIKQVRFRGSNTPLSLRKHRSRSFSCGSGSNQPPERFWPPILHATTRSCSVCLGAITCRYTCSPKRRK